MFDAIKQWAFTLVITAIVGGLANSFSISEKGNMKKYVKFACSAVALVVMIMPIKELFTEMPNLFNLYNSNKSPGIVEYAESAETENYGYINQINELTMAKTNELLKKRISDIVYEKTGIKPDDIYIYIKQENYPDVAIEKIIIDMPENIDDVGENKFDEVKLYLKQLFNCDVGRDDLGAPHIGEKTDE